MCMITRCWSFWCLHFSFTEKHHKKEKNTTATCQQHCYIFSHSNSKKIVQDHGADVRIIGERCDPHTWQVCGIGRGNHSVGLEWALCFHLGQWCRRGNFQPQPGSLSARWKTSTSWKWKQLWGRPVRAWRCHRQTPRLLQQYCSLQHTDKKSLSEQNIWTLKSKTLCPITRSDNPIIDQLYIEARGKLPFLIDLSC